MHVVLVHGWEGWPENAWFPWLRKELEAKGYTTEALALPDPAFPKREGWVRLISASIKNPDTVLVGHSLGCLAILWALDGYDGPPVKRVVCVSGFARPFSAILQNGPWSHEWFPHQLDLHRIKAKAESWAVIHATHDPLVPFAEGEWMAAELGVPLIVPQRTGHLMHVEKAFEVPEILKAIL